MTREEKQKWKISRQAKARNLMTVRPLLRHFPTDYSTEIRRFVDDEVLLHSRYIFVADKNRRDIGYCTHCRQEVGLPDKPKHNSDMLCPNCCSICQVKHDWRGHSTLIDKTYFHYYEKSKIDPKAIICRGIFAYRDYRCQFREIETIFETHTYYVFQVGNAAMFLDYKNYWYGMNHRGHRYEMKKTVYQRFTKYNQIKDIKLGISVDSIEEAVKDTPFQYSEWRMYYEDYNLADGFVKYFDLYAKYPCIEYIAKLGLGRLIESRIQGEPTLSALNLRGKTLPEVIRMKLNKTEIKELRDNAKKINTADLKVWQLSKKDGSNLSIEEIIKHDLPPGRIRQIAKYTSVKKIIWYLERQKQRRDYNYSFRQIMGDWADYINDCKTLELDLKEECVLFPRDLHTAHQNTIKQIKIQGDALLDKKIQKRLPGLEKRFNFENGDFIIRPAASSEELIKESKFLQHCVAAHYTKPYADGKTNILMIRRKTEPDKPFYTMEVSQNKIVQTRGLKNCRPTPEVQAFVDQFNVAKIQKQKGVKTA